MTQKKPLPGRVLPEPAPVRPYPRRPNLLSYPEAKNGVRYVPASRLCALTDVRAIHAQLDHLLDLPETRFDLTEDGYAACALAERRRS